MARTLAEATIKVRLLLTKADLLKLNRQLAGLSPKPSPLRRANAITAGLSQSVAYEKTQKIAEANIKQGASSNRFLSQINANMLRFIGIGTAISAAVGVVKLIASAQQEAKNDIMDLAQKTSMYAGTYRSFAGKAATKEGRDRFVKFNQTLENNGINTSEVPESINQFQSWLKNTDDKDLNDDLRTAKQQINEGTLDTTTAYMRLLKDWFSNQSLRDVLPDEALGGTDITKRYRGLTKAGQKDVINAIDGRDSDGKRMNYKKTDALIETSDQINKHSLDNQKAYMDNLSQSVVDNKDKIFNTLDIQLKNKNANLDLLKSTKDLSVAMDLLGLTIKGMVATASNDKLDTFLRSVLSTGAYNAYLGGKKVTNKFFGNK